MSDFTAKVHPIRFRLSLRPRPRWSLQRFPKPSGRKGAGCLDTSSPSVEGNSSVRLPHLIKDIRKVESVQRRFTKNCPVCTMYHIWREFVFVYKMLFGLVLLDFRIFFTSSPVDNTR